MGIPHLIATLKPYAVHGLLDETIVIDGPALAYHILHILNREGIVQPSYRLLGGTVVAWLDEVVQHGVDINAILFDGYLPKAKRPTRMKRTNKSFQQLNLFHSANTTSCSRTYLCSPETAIPRLFKCGTPSGKPFLPPSFHVPAIIDALRTSNRYRSLVQLVPGEADAFCAQHLLRHGGAVLTSDSDLLAHDLGGGRVVFFRDIYIDGASKLVCTSFCPGEICKRLGLASADSCRLAYERKCSPHATLPQVLRACNGPIVDSVGYESFCQEYLHHEVSPSPVSSQGQYLAIDSLDPRISELVLQLGQQGDGDENKIFLPILIEDPTRGSAWEQSTPIRQMAYTIARWIIPGTSSSVQEYRRVNSVSQKGRDVHLLPRDHALDFITELLGLIKKLEAKIGMQSRRYWHLLCLALDIKECIDLDKQSHALWILQESTKSPPSKSTRVAWETIHFVAQLQASYYSFRMLNQILSLGYEGPHEGTLGELRTRLSTVPQLDEFPDIDGVLEFLQQADELGSLRIIAGLVPLFQSAIQPQATEKTKKQKKPKKKATSKKATESAPNHASKNPFDLLAADQ